MSNHDYLDGDNTVDSSAHYAAMAARPVDEELDRDRTATAGSRRTEQ